MTLEGDSLCLATFTTSPSVVSISTSASETGFVVGDHITVNFDQEIHCGESCSVLFISGTRTLTVAIDVMSTEIWLLVGLYDRVEGTYLHSSVGTWCNIPHGNS